MLRNYVSEFAKIQLFTQEKKKLSAEDMVDIVHANRGFNIFEFTHALCEPSVKKTLEHVQQILLYKENIPGIFIMIVRHLVLLLKIKLYTERSLSKNEIVKIAGIPWFRYDRYARQAAAVSIEDMQNLLEAVLEADIHLKTGYQDEKMIVTLLVHRFNTVFSGNVITQHIEGAFRLKHGSVRG